MIENKIDLIIILKKEQLAIRQLHLGNFELFMICRYFDEKSSEKDYFHVYK